MDKLKLVKTAVIILTFLLVFGTLSFLGILFQKTHKRTENLPSQIGLKQPSGSYIKQFTQEDGRLYLLIIGGGQDDRVVIFDSNSGTPVTTVTIN